MYVCVLHKTHLMRTCKHKWICKFVLVYIMHCTKSNYSTEKMHPSTYFLSTTVHVFFWFHQNPVFPISLPTSKSPLRGSESSHDSPGSTDAETWKFRVPTRVSPKKNDSLKRFKRWTGTEIHRVTPVLHPNWICIIWFRSTPRSVTAANEGL